MTDLDIPKLVKELRERLGLTQEQFAQKVGVPFVVPFITKSDRSMGYRQNEVGEPKRAHEWVGLFDAETAKHLFDFDRLVRILAQFELPDVLDEQMKAQCRAAVEAAQALTSTRLKSPAPAPADSRTSS